MESGVALGSLRFPEKNGPIQWTNKALAEVLRPTSPGIEDDNSLEAA
jgi:hypothetical protein